MLLRIEQVFHIANNQIDSGVLEMIFIKKVVVMQIMNIQVTQLIMEDIMNMTLQTGRS